MKTTRRRVTHHRHQQKARGLVRVEVQAPAADAALIREVAAELRSGTRRAAEVRSLLRRSLKPRKSMTELLAMKGEIPDAEFDSVMVRQKDAGREVDL